MTKIQFCKNCKHLGLDGMFGLICEVSGNNKNYDCPKYEEKGGCGMSEKSFEITGYLNVDENQAETAITRIEEVLFDLPFEIYVEFHEEGSL